VKKGDTTTVEKSLQRTLREISTYEGAIKQCVTEPITQGMYDAAVSLSYNIGASAFCGSTAVKRWNAGDLAGGCAAFRMWNKAGGKVNAGLVARREKEVAMCLS
jgi:lysozyme